MFLNDYLMRMILQFAVALQKALNAQNMTPAQKADDLEQVVGDAVGIDPRLLFSMDADSLVSMLQLGDFDEEIGGYVLRSIYLEAEILDEDGNTERADLRRSQADAIARAYGFDVTPADVTREALEDFLMRQELSDFGELGYEEADTARDTRWADVRPAPPTDHADYREPGL
ncbi:MAG: hypothetical protein LBH64_00295 [Coriobacteriales bacterium]|jgi:hypothetical protein|nr:hypothetical protein [Coriobacteriales bacterium]